MRPKSSRVSAILAFCLFLFAARDAHAQAAGTVRGQVTDPSSALIPGVNVQFESSGLTRSAKTDAQGRYTLALPAGKYAVHLDTPGFAPFNQPEFNVSPGQVNSLDIALKIQVETQQVQINEEVAGQLSTDPSSNVGALVLRDEDLEALPDDPDDLQSDLEALAGPSAGPSGAQFFVDGFSGGQLPPKSSIREIRINSNPFSSEFDRPGFGRIEIFTKPGTDQFHGQAFFNFGDGIFDSRNPLLTTAAPGYAARYITGNIGGPLSKKASFFIDFNRRQLSETALINARVLDNNFNQVPYNSAYPTPQRLWMISPRIDYQLNSTNTLVARFNHTDNKTELGTGQYILPTQLVNQNIKNNVAQLTETAILGTKAIDETRFQFTDSHVNQTGAGPFNIPGLDVTGAFNSGGAPLASNYTHNKAYEVQNILTLTQGKHTVKLGGRLRQSDLASQSTTNFNGSWLFGQPLAPASGDWCLAGIPNPTSLDLYQQTESLLSQHVPMPQILNEGCGPTQFTRNTGTPLQNVRQLDLGLYVQDDWRFRNNLTVSAGLRYETQTNIRDHMDWAPRLSIAWAPGAKGNTPSKTVIRAGWGIFYDRFTTTNVLNALRYNGASQQSFLVNNSLTEGGTGAAAAALASYPDIPPLAVLTAGNQALYAIDRDFHAPYMMQTAIGAERALPAHMTLSVNYVNTRGVHVMRQRDINAFLPGSYIGPGTGVRPYPINDDIYLYESAGIFKQSQVITNLNARVNNQISLFGYYAYGQAHSNANGFPMDQYNANADWGRAIYDVRHRAFIGGNAGLPLGWVVAPFITMSSGLPFNITTGNAFNGDGIFNARPAFATSASNPKNVYTTPWGVFDAQPLPGETIIPYNLGDGPAQFSVNLRLSRTWGWGERTAGPVRRPNGGFGGGGGGRGGRGGGGFAGTPRGLGNVRSSTGAGKRYNLTFSIQARNAFNHANLGLPTGVLTSPFFGQSTTLASGNGQGGGGGGGGGGGAGGPGGGGGPGGANTPGALINAGGSAAGNRRVELQLRFQF
jgi:hypothetical protein